MTEELLQYIWKASLYSMDQLETTHGKCLKVISPGIQNTNAGPDFQNAKIRIGETLWVGNVEIHLKSSTWYAHHHNRDKAYSSIILHVVLEDDMPVYYSNKEVVPVFIPKINSAIVSNYHLLLKSNKPACKHLIGSCDTILITSWLNRMGCERLEYKSNAISLTLENNTNNWEETFYNLLFRYFGFSVNAIPFRLLSNNVPPQVWKKHIGKINEIEALLFGTAGFLNESYNDYQLDLQRTYRFLRAKYKLKPLDKSIWRFLRLRPNNFPTIRLAQLAFLLGSTNNLLKTIIEAKDLHSLYNLFRGVNTSSYWDNHYLFGKKASSSTPKKLGQKSIESLIINVVIPFLFAYGKYQGNSDLQNKAIDLAEELPEENNRIVNDWKDAKIKVGNAFRSQALLHVHQEYCEKQRCIDCMIGQKILLIS